MIFIQAHWDQTLLMIKSGSNLMDIQKYFNFFSVTFVKYINQPHNRDLYTIRICNPVN